jgi:hypothetical protein
MSAAKFVWNKQLRTDKIIKAREIDTEACPLKFEWFGLWPSRWGT